MELERTNFWHPDTGVTVKTTNTCKRPYTIQYRSRALSEPKIEICHKKDKSFNVSKCGLDTLIKT